ncbi:LysR family transcriptional regulator, partial [Vibrio sp. 2130-1]|nr:LysR family transcriptional regulator [Vibrio sp. 2130-1]
LEDLPPLPSVDIVLVTGVEPHPILDKERLSQLAELMPY